MRYRHPSPSSDLKKMETNLVGVGVGVGIGIGIGKGHDAKK